MVLEFGLVVAGVIPASLSSFFSIKSISKKAIFIIFNIAILWQYSYNTYTMKKTSGSGDKSRNRRYFDLY